MLNETILPHCLGTTTSYFGTAVWARAGSGLTADSKPASGSQGRTAIATSARAITVSATFV